MTSQHARHDRLLVVRLAGGDAYPSEAPEAEKLVASCSECSALAADIRLLSVRTGQLPAARRTRDFRLTTDDAERLRGSLVDRVMRRLAAPGWGTLRPVAGAAFAIGLTMTVVGSIPSMGAATPAQDDSGHTTRVTIQTGAPLEAEPAPDAAGGQTPVVVPAQPGGIPGKEGVAANTDASPAIETDPFSEVYIEGDGTAGDAYAGEDSAAGIGAGPLVLGGLLIATLALALLLASVVARRRFADPLLR